MVITGSCCGGFIDSGAPSGEETMVGGLLCYVSAPTIPNNGKAIVIASDIFGFSLPNVRLIADSYARRGFYCVVPSLYRNPVPRNVMEDIRNMSSSKSDFWSKMKSLSRVSYYRAANAFTIGLIFYN